MSTYTDVKTFTSTWPEGSSERLFVREAAEIAYAYINSALSGVYSVPFETVPDSIEKISNLLTRALAMDLTSKAQVTVKDIKDRGGIDPIQWLQDIRERKMRLEGVTPLTTTGAWCSTAGQMHIFDIDHELAHQPDSDRLDELADDRWSY